MNTLVKKRFIAGARCPVCSAVDRVLLLVSADAEWIECVDCGHTEHRPTEVTPQPPEAAQTGDTVGVVQFKPLR